jgi:Na+/glutamate symporter
MTYFLIGLVLGIIIGAILGAFILKRFNIVDTEYSIDHLKAKKGGRIDLKQKIEQSTPKEKVKRKLFNFKNRGK